MTQTTATTTNAANLTGINLLATYAPHVSERERDIYEEYALQTSLLYATYEGWFIARRRELLRFLALTTRQPAARFELLLPAGFNPEQAKLAASASGCLYRKLPTQQPQPQSQLELGQYVQKLYRQARNGKRHIPATVSDIAKATNPNSNHVPRPAAPAATNIVTHTFTRSGLLEIMHQACFALYEVELAKRDWLARLQPDCKPDHERAAFAHGFAPEEGEEAHALVSLVATRLEATWKELGRGAVDNRELAETLGLTYDTAHYYKYQLVDGLLLYALTNSPKPEGSGTNQPEHEKEQSPQPRPVNIGESVTRNRRAS